MTKLFRRLRARLWLWWYFRNRYCYICLRLDRTCRGEEELIHHNVRVWPCTPHARLASLELRGIDPDARKPACPHCEDKGGCSDCNVCRLCASCRRYIVGDVEHADACVLARSGLFWERP